MNSSGLGGSFLGGPGGGILDLEVPFHRHQQQSQMGHPSVTGQHHLNMRTDLENDHPIGLMELKGSNAGVNFGKGKGIASSNPANSNDLSDDDDAEDGNCENFDGGKSKKGSPWQRMKWTDNVVQLLIAVVSCVGDDGTINGTDGHKRKSGVLQKKGKWKTVSKIMISKGCHVSPQQCEDKFNDLNKRYKRLNDILGRGTCCQVVENPTLMDSMPNLSAKAKDDVRKILSSKHLFYKEMVFQDPTKSVRERREWIKIKMLQLQEQRVSYQVQALELEKQQFKWLRYCSKKDRELERLRLENERMKLENERRVLKLKQKEQETDLMPSQEDIRIERIENKRFPSIPQPCNDCDSEMDECFLKTLELCFDFVIIVCSKNTTIY
ncbi:hypothetical protein Ahy_A08g039109 isoform A [Arachis hypogaea]|uniref:Myb/SANT-like DNA-binding domain-containing protein n=1 Tax=Arachis hypogaea TaxID=3818 RepID=A0A445BVR9_ARAHY|nr:hypothetical protein Ahy_A08g039109 isoform A [Arachis hypogaea]